MSKVFLVKQKAPKTKPEKWSWEFSWAKEILRRGIKEGDITKAKTYDEIHTFHSEVEATDRKLLPSRMRALWQQFAADKGTADKDAADLEHDLKLFPISTHNYKGEPRWEGSNVQKQLREDIKEGLHLETTPEEFYNSRELYTKFYCQETIRQHIYQEIKFQKYCLFRTDNKKTKLKLIKSKQKTDEKHIDNENFSSKEKKKSSAFFTKFKK